MKSRFLVVDDDPIALEVAREQLEQLGFEVMTRLEAIGTSQWIAENQPDFILLDLMMPALSGSELAKVIKRRELPTGIILYSSKPRAELDAIAKQLGALGAIAKGNDSRRFATQLLRLIGPAALLHAS